MSEQKWTHTPNGPRSRLASIKDEKGLFVAFEVPIHLAPRIVACVNACAGISTEALEKGVIDKAVSALEGMLTRYVDLARDVPGFVNWDISKECFVTDAVKALSLLTGRSIEDITTDQFTTPSPSSKEMGS